MRSRSGSGGSLPKRIQIEKISPNVSMEHIREIFSKYGEIVNMNQPKHEKSKRAKDYVIIEYSKRKESDNAVKYMDGGQLDGYYLRIKYEGKNEVKSESKHIYESKEGKYEGHSSLWKPKYREYPTNYYGGDRRGRYMPNRLPFYHGRRSPRHSHENRPIRRDTYRYNRTDRYARGREKETKDIYNREKESRDRSRSKDKGRGSGYKRGERGRRKSEESSSSGYSSSSSSSSQTSSSSSQESNNSRAKDSTPNSSHDSKNQSNTDSSKHSSPASSHNSN